MKACIQLTKDLEMIEIWDEDFQRLYAVVHEDFFYPEIVGYLRKVGTTEIDIKLAE